MSSEGNFRLRDGSRIGVVGGGPAGAFFSYFLLELVRAAGFHIHLDVYEPQADAEDVTAHPGTSVKPS